MEEIEVCICKSIFLHEILEVINNEEIKDLEELIEKTGAGTVCKLCISCKYDVYGERDIHLDELLK